MNNRVNRAFGAVLFAAALAASSAGERAFAQAPAQETETTGMLAVDREATSAGSEAGRIQEPLSPEAAAKLRSASAETTDSPTTPARQHTLPNLSTTETVVLAAWDGGTFTNHDLSSTLQLRRPPSAGQYPVEQIMHLPGDRLRPVVRDLIYELALYRKAKAEGLTENSPEIAERLKRHRETVLNRMIFQRSALPLLIDTEEKAAREHYEKYKAELYTAPGILTVRNMHILTYLPYTVKEEDTLASIAENVVGDAAAVTGILRDEPLHYPRIPLAGVGGQVPTVEVKPGERLLIPMSRDDVTSAQNAARIIRESLAGGESFEEVQKRFPHAVAAHGGKPYTPEFEGTVPAFREAVLGPDATTTSEVIRTPWGFSVVQIADRQPTRTLSFEEVEEKVFGVVGREETQSKTMEEVRGLLFERLGKKYGMKLNEDALKRNDYGGADPLPVTTPIASAPDFTYTLEQFLTDLRPTERGWGSMSAEERITMVKGVPSVVQYLFLKEAEAERLDKLPGFQEDMKSKGIMEVVSEYMRREQESISMPSEAHLREFYQQNLDRYTSAPKVTLREITKRVNFNAPDEKRAESIEKAKKELAQLRARFKSQADFEQAARRESESLGTRSRGGSLGTVESNFRGEAFENQIAQLKPGEVSEPFLYGAEVVIVRLDERQPSTVVPFEDVIRQVRTDYLREVPVKLRAERRDQVLSEANYQPKF